MTNGIPAPVAGDSILLGYFTPGMSPPSIPTETVLLGVTEKMAARSRYFGAVIFMEEHGSLVVFYDPETRICYAQGA